MTVRACVVERGEATVAVPRELLVVLRAEVRRSGGHCVQGFTAAGDSLVQHDRRMPGGGCLTCAVLAVTDYYLHPPVVEAVAPGEGG